MTSIIKNEILFPIFLECCQYTKDSFWENIFEELAYGKTPYGTYISLKNNSICCSYKKKEFNYKIENDKDGKLIHDEVYELLTTKLGLLSHTEKLESKKAFLDAEEDIKESRKDWNSIRKKNIKELLIELYVGDMKKKYFLSIISTRYLLSIILISMVFKIIVSTDINYSNGKINSITGIEFSKNKIIIGKELYKFEMNLSPHIVVDKKLMSDNWEKYLKELRKGVFHTN